MELPEGKNAEEALDFFHTTAGHFVRCSVKGISEALVHVLEVARVKFT